ncbi:KDM5 [Mytilus coruscus]|uniref:KDM5 n=1 Tax=Mytilus coruscus TaxID=42192 RepID=A0A6J8CSL5_MYTCO|nr:KDM5 [Mytilus coruscus]
MEKQVVNSNIEQQQAVNGIDISETEVLIRAKTIITSDNCKAPKPKRKAAKTKMRSMKICICQQPPAGEMIQCNWCQDWYHNKCMSMKKDDNVVFWICVQCRTLPKVVNDIQSQLASVIQNNVDLVKDIAAKTVQIQSLQAENSRLRDLVNRA